MGKIFFKMLNLRILAIIAVISAFSLGLCAQAPTAYGTSSKSEAPAHFYPLAQLKEGMQGKARTVFRGSEAEEFNVEILGVIPGAIGPKQDLIVGRLSGGGADRTAVFAGMSGSPVYIDGK